MPKRDLEDYQRRAVLAKKGMQQKATFSLPEGKTTFRILNTPVDRERNSPKVWIEYYQHYNVGPKKFRQRCGLDPLDDSGDCWGCNKIEKLIQKGETKLAKEMEKKRVFEVQAAIWDDDLGGLRGPVRWPVSGTSAKSLAYMLMTICGSDKAKKFLDHERGYNFTIERSGMKMTDTNYTSPIKDDDPSQVPVEIVRKLKAFVDVVPAYDEEAFKKAYYGQDDDDEGEEKMAIRKRRDVEEEEEEVVRPKRKIRDEEDVELPDDDDDEPRPKKKKVVVEEEEDLEYGEEEEVVVKKKPRRVIEEEEEEEPVRKPKRRVVVEEEEEEEEPAPKPKRRVVVEDDEEEEEAPRPKRKVVVEEEEEEEPTPKRRRPPVVEEDEEEEEPVPKPKRKVVVEEEEEEEEVVRPKRRVRVVEEEEEEEESPRAKPRRR